MTVSMKVRKTELRELYRTAAVKASKKSAGYKEDSLMRTLMKLIRRRRI